MTVTPKPAALPVDDLCIPDELKQRPQWVVWKFEFRDGKWTKPPFDPRTGKKAKADDPATWVSYETALAAYQRGGWDGIGYEFAGDDPFTGWDFDTCRDPDTGEIDEAIAAHIDALDSYTECSPSGTGVHVLVRAALEKGKRTGKIEVYDRGRYFTVTGHYLTDRSGIEARQAESDALYARRFTSPEPPQLQREPRTLTAPESVPAGPLTDDAILAKIRTVANAAKFERLWAGDTSMHGGDDSAADQALANLLGFYTQDTPQLERLMRQSGLARDKWGSRRGETTYLGLTIATALKGLTERWQPGGSSGAADTVAAATPEPWGTPQPLEDVVLPGFPVHAFPPVVRAFVDALAAATETDPALAGAVCLGTLGTAARNVYDVAIEPGYSEPTNLYIAAFLPSGSRKTQVFRDATQAVVRYERARAREERVELARWRAARKIEEQKQDRMERDAAKAEGGKATELIIRAQANAAELEAEREPVVTKLIADDVTAEQLATLLATQRGFISVMSPEGGSLFGNISGRYTKGFPNLDTLLKGHAGDDIRVDRGSRPPEFVPRPRINMVISPQPRIATDLGQIPGFHDRGGSARMLACFPRSNVGYRSLRSLPIPDDVRAGWDALVAAILTLEPKRVTDADGFLVPCAISLSPDAWRVWKAFHHELEAMMRPGQPLATLREWANKAHGAAARIAGLLHTARYAAGGEPESVAIHADTMQAAIDIMWFFVAHAQAFHDHLSGIGDLSRERRLLEALLSIGPTTTKRALFQQVRGRAFPKTDDLEAPLEMLEALDWIRVIKLSPVSDKGPGGRPSYRIDVNPDAYTQNPQNAQNLAPESSSEGFEGFVLGDTPERNDAPAAADTTWEEIA
jgi:hypothetical protein